MTTKSGRLPGAGRFLLLAALLLGIVTMHTLGHPREHEPSAERATTGHARVTAEPGHARGAGHARVDVGHAETQTAQALALARGNDGDTAAAPRTPTPHDSGMDPLSLCLAVLGAALTLALLQAAVRHGLRGTPVHPHRRARALITLRPNPPPPRNLLTHLSVLRV